MCNTIYTEVYNNKGHVRTINIEKIFKLDIIIYHVSK